MPYRSKNSPQKAGDLVGRPYDESGLDWNRAAHASVTSPRPDGGTEGGPTHESPPRPYEWRKWGVKGYRYAAFTSNSSSTID